VAENDGGAEWEENVFIVRVKHKSFRYLACKNLLASAKPEYLGGGEHVPVREMLERVRRRATYLGSR